MARTLTDKKGIAQRCSACGEVGHKSSIHRRDTSKVCTSCKRDLPIGDFYFTNKVGKESVCKYPCSRCKSCDKTAWSDRYKSGFHGRFVRLLGAARSRSKSEGWAIDIDTPFLLGLLESQDHKCYYTGQPLTFAVGDAGVSIDRRDPSLGYVRSNVVLTSWIVNNMKRHLSEAAFVGMCRMVADWRP